MSSRSRCRHGVRECLGAEGLVLEGVERAPGQVPELVLTLLLCLCLRGGELGGVGEPGVLVVDDELHYVIGTHDPSVPQNDWPCDVQELLKSLDVDRDDAVYLFARRSLPHASRQLAVHIELRGEAEVPPVDTGQQPSPALLDVAAHRNGPGCKGEGARGNQTAHVGLPVVGGEEPRLQEATRTGAHLGGIRRRTR